MQATSVLSWMALVVLGAALAVSVMVAAWVYRELFQRSQWHGAERRQALEPGAFLPPDESPWPRAVAAISIGAGVPLGAFGFAWLTTLFAPMRPSEQALVWSVVLLVNLTALGCGTRLAFPLPGSGRRTEQASLAKPPAFDPESFEVAGHELG